jgi:proteasome lid subunit RPN8/RPN11
MEKTMVPLNISDILKGVAENVKASLSHELFFQGGRKIKSVFRVFLRTEKGNILIGFACIKRNKLSWWANKRGRRFYCKYALPADVIPILANFIEIACRNVYPLKKAVKKTIQKITGISLVLTDDVLKKIKSHIFTKPDVECGGYLIGQIQWSDDEQNVIGYVDDIFHDDSVGTEAQFVFTSQYGLKAYSYCMKTYRNTEGVSTKKIIGNYHSHGDFNAFFSDTDREMIFAGTAPEFYLVISPGQMELTALFKNKQQKLFAVSISQDMDFNYCGPTISQASIDYSRKGE